MIRIAGVTLNPNKQIRFALTYVKGIGKSNVKLVLSHFNYNPSMLLGDLSDNQVIELRNYIENNFTVEADLRRQTQSNIKRLIDLKTRRGKRHQLGLPVRGQTTKTNSRTRRGNRKNSAASGKIKTPAKK